MATETAITPESIMRIGTGFMAAKHLFVELEKLHGFLQDWSQSGEHLQTEVANYLKSKVSDAVDAGHTRMIIDIHELKNLHMGVIKLLFQTMQTARELTLQFALVGNAQIITECKGFEDTRN